jgi:hypothetical protein
MAQNFPNSPTNGDTTVINGITYTYVSASSKWRATQVGGSGASSGGAGVTTYADTATMVTAAPDAGSLGYVTANENLYIYNGSGWSKVDTTNLSPVINSVQDASANTSPFNLATDGTPTVITVSATDPEGFPLTYTYGVTSGSLGTTATVTQGTAPNTNEFTITPGTNDPADAGSFELTFTVDDGVTTAATSVADFTLSFVTAHNNVTAFASGGVTNVGVSDTIDYWSTSLSGTQATVFGNMATASYRQGALADGPGGRGCIFAGGWSPMVDTIQYITVATPGNAQSFGTISSGTRTIAGGCSDYTYGVILAGNQGGSGGTQTDLKVMDRFTVQTLGNTTDHGDLVNDHNASMSATSPAGSSRGVVTGGFSSTTMEYFDISTPGNAAVFGNTTGDAMGHCAGMSDDTYAVFGPDDDGNDNALEYITVDTLGNAQSFGTISQARYYCAGTDNLTYGFLVGGEKSGVNSFIHVTEVVTIATPGNASNFNTLSIGRQAASAAAA